MKEIPQGSESGSVSMTLPDGTDYCLNTQKEKQKLVKEIKKTITAAEKNKTLRVKGVFRMRIKETFNEVIKTKLTVLKKRK